MSAKDGDGRPEGYRERLSINGLIGYVIGSLFFINSNPIYYIGSSEN